MATKNNPLDPAIAAPNVIAPPDVIAGHDPQSMPPTPTPENTPVPGGGRYRWDIAAPGWVDLDAPADPDTNPIQPE